MKAILKKDVRGLGKARDIVEVKSGYFQNYLAKNGFAVALTPENQKLLQEELANEQQQQELLKQQCQKTKEILQDKTVVLQLKTGAGQRLYGAVTSKDIAEAIQAQFGCEVDKRKIETASIREIGQYKVHIKLHPQITVTLNVTIEAEDK